MNTTPNHRIFKTFITGGVVMTALLAGAGFAAAGYHSATVDTRAAAEAEAQLAAYNEAVAQLHAVDLEYQANAAYGHDVSTHRITSAAGLVYTDVDHSGTVSEGDMYVDNGVVLVIGAPGSSGDIQ